MVDTTEQNKVVSLFRFISELNQLKQKTILNYKDYSWFIELSNLPDDPENIQIYYRDRLDEEESDTEIDNNIIFSVHKPEFQICPEPNLIFKDWLFLGWDNFHRAATVKEINTKDESNIIYFNDSKERVTAYENWLKLRDAWAEKQKIIESTRNLFEKLYSIYFELQRESETEEIIVANGIICDKNNNDIRHPVLTHRVKLDYDADKNTVFILDTEVPSELYSVAFQTMERVNLDNINELNEELQENDYHPLDRIETPKFLKKLVRNLAAESIFSESGIPVNWSNNNRLLLYMEPCYIVRKRLNGTLKAIEQIIENVKEHGEIPAPIGDIVSGGRIEIPEDKGEKSIEEQLAAIGGESVEILLSKEANREQLEIARRIENYNAVLVQGPPGTGKTHTIANLIGHFLANGKNVLVTSHTTKALRVLKEKVATNLQSLCVAILDDSNADMERSVDGITNYMSKTTSPELKREMDKIAEERIDVIQKLADVRRKMFSVIRRECNCIVYNGENISPSQAAKFVTDNAENLSYIPGNVRLRAPLPLTFAQLTNLYRSNETVSGDDEIELSNDLPSPDMITSPSEFSANLEKLQELKILIETIENKNFVGNDNKIISTDEIFSNLPTPLPEIEAFQDLKDYVLSFGKIESWMKAVASNGKEGGVYRERWLKLIEQIQKANNCAEAVMEEQFGVNVCFADNFDMELQKPIFEKIRAIFSEDGEISWLKRFFNKKYDIALASVTIDGRKANSVKDCDIILHKMELEEILKQCAKYWDNLMAINGVPNFYALDTVNPERIAKNYIELIQKFLDWFQNDYKILFDKVSAVGLPADEIFKINSLDSARDTTNLIFSKLKFIPPICDILTAKKQMEIYYQSIDATKSVLLYGKRGKSRICNDILSAIEEENKSKYAENYAELEKMYEKYTLLSEREEMLKTLEPVAPQWAAAISNRVGVHGQFTVPSDIESAWKWKQLWGIVEEITATPFDTLQADSLRLSKEYRKITALYAEKKSWYHLLRRTEKDIDIRQALQGWKLTIKKIGKGTGKQAPKLKARARELMAKCQNAVPVWIMPISGALENLNPKRNKFDVVIIDEASQSDISSLAILYMGKKLIIVGDDKQVSPMAVGVDNDKMEALQQMYLKDKIPNAHLYNAKTSIYDIASTTFQPLMLREHFRCVPEIIGFSNMLSYDYKIKPLREASSSILLPAVVNYRVDGQRDGRRKINYKEAQAIIALMKACMEQPEYSNKSFGVISLLGDEGDQVKEISKLIEQEIDPKEVQQRKILCGNSANFQGDERDVIFLSMVDSGNDGGTIRKMEFGNEDANRKRYNVAVSRARDQIWLVHSLDSANDLKPGDIRKKLIDYTTNPYSAEIVNSKIEENAESPFEASVAKLLVNRGYHIVQQWKVGAYRLDMVAVCGKQTVAIECDGERWHSGENKIREDMERQTILERIGWRFIRIRGSEYYRNAEKTIVRVISELSEYGIEPEESNIIALEDRESELLNRVKNRAAAIMSSYDNFSTENVEETIETALNPKIMTSADRVPKNMPNLENLTVTKKSVPLHNQFVKDTQTIKNTKTVPTVSATLERNSSDEEPIFKLLKKHNISYKDKRLNGGALWIIGGKELNSVVLEAGKIGYNFKFTKGGGKLTNYQDGWWTK